MFDDALSQLEREVEAGESGVPLFEMLHDAQRVQVVIEPIAEPLHLAVQFLLAGVRERWVSHVVRQREGLGQILVQSERHRDRPCQLGHFNRVREADSGKWSWRPGVKDLGFVLQPPECARMHDAIAVSLEVAAVRVGKFG
jgi:hypothetical protein